MAKPVTWPTVTADKIPNSQAGMSPESLEDMSRDIVPNVLYAPPEPERDTRDWIVPTVLAAGIVLLPPVVHALVPAAAAGWGIVGLLLVMCGLAGWRDGVRFRASWTLPLIVAGAFYLTMQLYYGDETWIYLPILAAVAWGAAKAGEKTPGSRRSREGF